MNIFDQMNEQGRISASKSLKKLNLPLDGPQNQEQISDVMFLSEIMKALFAGVSLNISQERQEEIVKVALEESRDIAKSAKELYDKVQEHGRN